MSQAIRSSQGAKVSIKSVFKNLPDPLRHHGKVIHPLLTIVVIALCATVAGADDYQSIVAFARERRDWFGKFLDLTNGIPSHDTFERVFAQGGRMNFYLAYRTEQDRFQCLFAPAGLQAF